MANDYRIRLIGELKQQETIDEVSKQLEVIKIKAPILEGSFTAQSIAGLSEQISKAVDEYAKKREKSPIGIPIKIAKVDGKDAIEVFKSALQKEINTLNIAAPGTHDVHLEIAAKKSGNTDEANAAKERAIELEKEETAAIQQNTEAQREGTAATEEGTKAKEDSAAASKKKKQASDDSAKSEAKALREQAAAEKKRNNLIRESITLLSRQAVYFKKNPMVYNSKDNMVDADSWKYHLKKISAGDFKTNEDAEVAIGKYRTWFGEVKTAAVEAGITGATAIDRLKAAVKKFGSWNIMTAVMTKLKRGLIDIIKNVEELDAAMTELRKVTDETSGRYERFVKESATAAKELGVTLVDIVNATSTFARLGYNIDDASEYAKVATVYKNVGDSIKTIDDAASSLVSTMKAFKLESIEDAWSIVDLFNEVGNSFATTSGDIGEAMKRSAAALMEAGNSIEESVGLYTAAQTIVQDADVVGTALKTLSMRLRGAKTDLESAGLDVDGLAESTSSLRAEILALSGVDIMKSASEFKSTYEMLSDLSQVWDKIESETSRARVLELIAGKRMASTVAAIISNFDIAREVVGLDYTGSALKENEKYLESIAGQLDVLKASYEEFSNLLLNGDAIKFVIKSGNTILSILNGINNFAIGGSHGLKISGFFSNVIPVLTMISKILDKSGKGDYRKVEIVDGLPKIVKTERSFWGGESGDLLGFFGLKSDEGARNYLKEKKSEFEKQFEKLLLEDKNRDKEPGGKEKELIKIWEHLGTDKRFKDPVSNEEKTADQLWNETKSFFGEYAAEAETIVKSSDNAADAAKRLGEAVAKNTVRYKAFTIAAKAANVAMSAFKSILVSYAIQLVVNGITKIFDELEHGMENAIDRMDSAKKELKDVESKIDDTKTKLEDTQSKISDIQSLGKLSITDSSDLKNLQATNAQLLVQLSLLEKERELAEKKANAAENAVWNRYNNSKRDGYSISQISPIDRKRMTQSEYVDYMSSYLPEQYRSLEELNKLAEQRPLTKAEASLAKQYEQNIQTAQANLVEIANILKDVGTDAANEVVARIAYMTADGETQIRLFNSYLGSVSEEAKNKILEMAAAGSLTEGALANLIPEETLNAIIALCGGSDNLIVQFESMANTGDAVTNSLFAQARELESINADMDSLQGSYKSLVEAVSEYNANGYLTVDTLQSFLALSDDYIEALTLENGKLVMNTESIIALANARLDEMLAKKWNQTIETIDTLVQEAKSTDETTESIKEKTYAIEDMTEAALQNYVVEQLGLKSEKEISSEIQSAINAFNTYKAMINSTRSGLGKYTNTTLGAADATKSLTDAIKKQYEDMIDKEKARVNAAKDVLEDRKKDLQDELKALEDQYEAEDKLLELQKAKDRYEAAKANKNVRLYTADKGWQWVSDPQELEDAKTSLDELHKEMERDEAKKAIQDQIDAIDDLIDKCDEALDILGQDWDDYIDHLNLVAELQGLTMDQLGAQVEGFKDRAVAAIREYAEALAAAQAAASNPLPSPGGNDGDWTKTKAGQIITDVMQNGGSKTTPPNTGAAASATSGSANLPNAITKPWPIKPDGTSDIERANNWVEARATGKKKLASGSKYISASDIYNVDDGSGEELIAKRGRYTRLEVGDGVVPADLTERLFALAKSPEEYIMPKVSGLFATLAANLIGRPGQVQQSAQQPIYIAKVEVTGVEDVDGFLDELTKIVNRKRKV